MLLCLMQHVHAGSLVYKYSAISALGRALIALWEHPKCVRIVDHQVVAPMLRSAEDSSPV